MTPSPFLQQRRRVKRSPSPAFPFYDRGRNVVVIGPSLAKQERAQVGTLTNQHSHKKIYPACSSSPLTPLSQFGGGEGGEGELGEYRG